MPDLLGSSGVFFRKFKSDTQELISKKDSQFEREFVLSKQEKKDKKKILKEIKKGKDAQIEFLKLQNLIINKNGGAVLISEQIDLYKHLNKDIIITSFSTKGDVLWANKITKLQVYETSNLYVSYGLIVNKDKLFFIYRDNIKNYNNTIDAKIEKAAYGYKSISTIYEVTVLGEMKKNILAAYSDIGVGLMPFCSKQVTDNILLITGWGRRLHKVAKVTILD